MPVLNGNSPKLLIGGVDSGALFISVQQDVKNAGVETSAGTGITHKQRAAGLNDTVLKFELVYNTANVATYLPLFRASTIETVEYGPEGAVSTKPRHVQSMLCDSVSHGMKVSKEKVMFTVSFSGADAPSVDMYAGGVYP